MIGANPTDGHPVFASRMKKRLREGAKLIVIDPRRIDLVRTPHVEASYHLPLRPGTNVAMLTALAHVIVTEGLVRADFVDERCDIDAYDDWADFVGDPRHSPEAVEAITGVPRGRVRGAARLYATGGNGAIYYGLGVTEHSQGSTAVMAIANLAMATGNIGRRGVGVNPLRGQNNVQGSCDMGSFPHELPGYRHVSDAAVRAIYEQEWGVTHRPRTRPAHPQHDRRGGGGNVSAASTSRARTSPSPIPTRKHITAGLKAMECVVVHDLFLNETANYAHVFLPGATLPGEGRHVHQRRTPHQPGAQGDGAAGGHGRLGSDAGDRQRDGLSDALHPPVGDHGGDRSHDADFRGRLV